MQAITAGDLASVPYPRGDGEAARLMVDLARLQQSVRSMVLTVKQSSERIVEIVEASGRVSQLLGQMPPARTSIAWASPRSAWRCRNSTA
jgi:methyl-accepting chemotaxis protein